MNRIIYILFIICLQLGTLMAQDPIKGKVVDEKSNPLKDVRVSIDGSQYVYTRANGEFSVKVEAKEGPQVVKANKEGLVIKDWKYTGKEVQVVMSTPKLVRGRVLSDRNVPVSGVNILIIGIRGLDPVKTNNNGDFTLQIPQGTAIRRNSFAIFDASRLRGKANYEVQLGKDSTYYLLVNIPPRPVRYIRVETGPDGPISGETIIVDNKSYVTDATGTIRPDKGVNDFSSFQATTFNILDLVYVDQTSTMVINVQKPLENEAVSEGPVTTIDDKREALTIVKEILDVREAELNKEIEQIQEALQGNITAEERAQLQRQLQDVRRESREISDAQRIEQENALATIKELEETFSIRQAKTEEELKRVETERENERLKSKIAQTNASRNILIGSIIAVALFIIAIVFYINNRKISRQKDELSDYNNRLEQYTRDLDHKNREINEKNDQLLAQTKELENKNSKITDSIRYARTIQQSILPDLRLLNGIFNESFIFYAPRDIVSGDFYWFTQKGDDAIVIAADCTGHGVPGAFMTVMGNSLLNQIINDDDILDPSEILKILNQSVKETLKQHESNENRDGDGMDMGVLKINMAQKSAVFAGAKNPLYYVKNNELFYIKGSNISIGSTLTKGNKEFENRYLFLEGDEIFYLVSDGFQDQLGGNGIAGGHKRKKYMKTRFMDFILKNSNYPLSAQEKIFRDEFFAWKNEHDQTDDVVVIGLKL